MVGFRSSAAGWAGLLSEEEGPIESGFAVGMN